MKLKLMILVAVIATPAWAIQFGGMELAPAVPDSSSSALLWVGMGLIGTIARRRFK